MAKYKSAMGKVVDMATLMAKNETVRAVGNATMNARGDTIDSSGNIISATTKRVGNRYQKTVSNRTANIVRRNDNQKTKPIVDDIDLTSEEMELLDTTSEDTEIEKIKAKKNGK